MAVTINTLNGGSMTVTLVLAGHPETRVTYSASSGLSPWSGNIVGTLEGYMIPNVSDVQTVDIGNTVTDIYNDAFDGCSGLTTVTIPDSVTSICGYVFNDCTSLSSITFPSSVESFSEGVINGCSNLHTVNCPGRTCYEVEVLAQGGGLDRAPTGEGDYMDYICSDGTNSIVAESDGEGGYWWTAL